MSRPYLEGSPIYFQQDEGGGSLKTPDQLNVSVRTILESNQSDEAKKRREKWHNNFLEGKIRIIRKCSDSREITADPTTEIVVAYIAAGGPVEACAQLVNMPEVECNQVMPHFDGKTIENKTGVAPKKCGGADEKEKQRLNGDPENGGGINGYIKHQIPHPDILVSGIITARALAHLTGKSILVAPVDHRNFKIYPVAHFATDESGHIAQRIMPRELQKCLDTNNYDPKIIYAEGIPTIPEHELPEEQIRFILDFQRRAVDMKRRYPNLEEMQGIQSPPLVYFSTEIRPIEVMVPELDVPGTVFQTFVPRQRVGSSIRTPLSTLIRSIVQLEYPISQAIKNHGKPGEPFSTTRRLWINTDRYGNSLKISEALGKKPWMKEWLRLPDHHIYVSESNNGEIVRMEQITGIHDAFEG